LTDSHIRILRMVAKQRQRELADHDDADTASADRRRHLEQAAGRTKTNVAAAEARRHYKAGGERWARDSPDNGPGPLAQSAQDSPDKGFGRR